MNGKQRTGLERNTIDKYYTKPETVNACIEYVKQYLAVEPTDCIIEPSAGNGAFIPAIQTLSPHCIFYDIQPESSEIVQQDYLAGTYGDLLQKFRKIHVIGNPPFGRQSSCAIQFIKKSCEFCHSVSFILPKSFKKESLRKSFPLAFHLLFEIDVSEKSFFVDGVEHDVPCVFQIWEKKAENRRVTEKIDPLHFTFVAKTENPDISFRRVGVNAGAIDTNIEQKSVQSHYFIKFDEGIDVTEIVAKLAAIRYDFNNTVGPKSISKQELIAKFNPILGR
uniref:Methyltransferase n=1 Tax=viral metagenome TaxID=1070528 RepID=A0A6C0KKC5_9ZZZZ